MDLENIQNEGPQAYAEFHQELERIIKASWGIEPKYSEPFSWGYSSTAFYIKDTEEKEYVALLADNAPSKRADVEKNIGIVTHLDLSLNTPRYMKNSEGNYLLDIENITIPSGDNVKNKIMVFYEFLPGIPPFEMTLDILKQSVGALHEIHQHSYEKFENLLDRIESPKQRFLHGDPTPSNLLVSHGKLVSIVDFEMALLGPIEYDLARLAVFSWFRSDKHGFREIADTVIREYPGAVDGEMTESFALVHADMHLSNVKSHGEIHESPEEFKKELLFAEERAKELRDLLA
jgi:tRNA A-37 threonylcarbamoyl transferase component Bud32